MWGRMKAGACFSLISASIQPNPDQRKQNPRYDVVDGEIPIRQEELHPLT